MSLTFDDDRVTQLYVCVYGDIRINATEEFALDVKEIYIYLRQNLQCLTKGKCQMRDIDIVRECSCYMFR